MKNVAVLSNNEIYNLQAQNNLKCGLCKTLISKGQYVYRADGKFYHECCSARIKGRVKIL